MNRSLRGLAGIVLFLSAAAIAQVQTSAAAQTGGTSKQLPPFIKPLPADAPQPSKDPRDFHGAWMQLDRTPAQIVTADGQTPPLTAAGSAARQAAMQAANAGQPLVHNAILCRPPGTLYLLGLFFPVRIVQNEREVVFVFERFHSTWRIFIDASHPRHPPKSYLGHSIGHWEGDTLVVDTVGLRGSLWLDDSGTRLSDVAHLTTRITKRVEEAALELVTTIDDPKTYTAPWTVRQAIDWRPDFSLLAEHDCEETSGSLEEARKYGYSLAPLP